MIDFTPTEQQLTYKKWVREFMQKHVKPVILEKEKIADPYERFPWDLVEKAHEVGLKNLGLPKECGGPGLDAITAAMVYEEMGAVDFGFSTILQQYWTMGILMAAECTEEQKKKFLLPGLDDPRFLLCVAVTEPDAGFDNLLPYDDSKAGLMLSAEFKGNEVILNGMKHFITPGAFAKVLIVFARTDKSVGITKGVTAFIVPADAPGFKVGRLQVGMGWRTCPGAELHFDDCRIPKENQLSPLNEGFRTLVAAVTRGTLGAQAAYVGLARTAFEKSLEYAKTRVQGGKPIIEHQIVARQLGEMWLLIESTRNMILKAAWQADHPEHNDPRLNIAIGTFPPEMATKVALHAIRIHGGMGVMNEAGVEKLLRDSAHTLHFAPIDVRLAHLGRILSSRGGDFWP